MTYTAAAPRLEPDAAGAEPARVVVLNFGSVAVGDTEAVGRVAATIVAERAHGVDVVAVLPPYGRAADELARLVSAVSASPHPRELDMLVSSGASMAAALCAMAVHRRGCRAVSLEGAQAGIVTDGAHTCAEVVEIRPERIESELQRHGVVLVSGAHGVSRDTGELTTLGAGGHDAVARELAAALGGEAVHVRELDGDGPLCSREFDASLRTR